MSSQSALCPDLFRAHAAGRLGAREIAVDPRGAADRVVEWLAGEHTKIGSVPAYAEQFFSQFAAVHYGRVDDQRVVRLELTERQVVTLCPFRDSQQETEFLFLAQILLTSWGEDHGFSRIALEHREWNDTTELRLVYRSRAAQLH